ncbi:MAG: hypothetical protein KJS92_07985 [Bacteroidetes bacterium]|nr:hypothetical protein [Bacteroidota bacterium]
MGTGIFQKKNLPELLFGGIFLLFAFRLNLQFLDGANINHFIAGHDEYLTIREVYSILEPASIKHWFLAVIGGDILYYGRVVFYSDALIAWLPYKIWGISGLVMAVRMARAIWILLALIVLGRTFIRKTGMRVFWYWGAGALLYTLYFTAMPKPEPIQLLFLALFFRGWATEGSPRFGKHYFWLGLAFAAKFNILTTLPFLFALPLLGFSPFKDFGWIKQALRSFAFFMGGFFAGIPCLLLSPVKPIYLQTYLRKTFLGTERYYDNQQLGFSQWMQQGLGQEYLFANWAAYLFLALLIWVIADGTLKALKDRKPDISWVIGITGFILLMSIMFMSKRLWPHYLWTGYILSWFALIRYAAEHWNTGTFRRYSVMPFVFFGCLLPAYGFFGGTVPAYLHRADLPEMKQESASADALYEYLNKNYAKANIGVDWSIKYPYSYYLKAFPYQENSTGKGGNENRIKWYSDHIEEIWDNNDVVVFRKNYPPALLKRPAVAGAPVSHDSLYRIFIRKTTPTVPATGHSNTGIFYLDTVIQGNYVFRK